MIERIAQDLRVGFRTLVNQPMVSVVAVLSVTLGIGADTTISTVDNAVFLTPMARRFRAERSLSRYSGDDSVTNWTVGQLNLDRRLDDKRLIECAGARYEQSIPFTCEFELAL